MTSAHARRAWIDDRPGQQVFRVRRDVFTDPQVFDLELQEIFGRSWIFVALDAQLPNAHDFITTRVGKASVLVTRHANGSAGAYYNVCPHKGAMLVRLEQGNRRVHNCAYHGWTFDSTGRNIYIKDHDSIVYPDSFEQESHDLKPLPRVEAYQGLIFAALTDDVPPLMEWLGEARLFIDLAMQQGPDGMEVVPGRIAYTYAGNWKLQMDNGMDGYHLTSTHGAFMDVMNRRSAGDGYTAARQFDWSKRLAQQTGNFSFPHGHSVHWMDQAEVEKRPIYPVIGEIRARVGPVKADWMLKGRSLTLFPNTQIADQTSLILRTFRPISVDLTEMRVFCIAPKGESPERRQWRLRQFEDFFNASGLATPDDTVIYEAVQSGCASDGGEYLQGYYRGMSEQTTEPNSRAQELGIRPDQNVQGVFKTSFETTLHAQYREWNRLMTPALARMEKAS